MTPQALVTGASAGIGLEIAAQLMARGHDILGVGASDRIDSPEDRILITASLSALTPTPYESIYGVIGGNPATRRAALLNKVLPERVKARCFAKDSRPRA